MKYVQSNNMYMLIRYDLRWNRNRANDRLTIVRMVFGVLVIVRVSNLCT